MEYKKIVKGIFRERPNRFIAYVDVEGMDNNPQVVHVKKYGESRFDFYIEGDNKKAWMEVKGVTLEKDGVVLFPDAPSKRAVKHIEHLIKAKEEGFDAYIMFVVQMENVKYFTPNKETHKAFAEVLVKAESKGVKIMAYNCVVTEKELKINNPVEIKLNK